MILRLGPDAVLDTRLRPVVLTVLSRAEADLAEAGLAAGADAVEVPCDPPSGPAQLVAAGVPVLGAPSDPEGLAALADAGVSTAVLPVGGHEPLVASARRRGLAVLLDDQLDRLMTDEAAQRLRTERPGTGPPVLSLATGASLADQCALVLLGLHAGRRVVRTCDPRTARRIADLWEALARERAGVFR